MKFWIKLDGAKEQIQVFLYFACSRVDTMDCLKFIVRGTYTQHGIPAPSSASLLFYRSLRNNKRHCASSVLASWIASPRYSPLPPPIENSRFSFCASRCRTCRINTACANCTFFAQREWAFTIARAILKGLFTTRSMSCISTTS